MKRKKSIGEIESPKKKKEEELGIEIIRNIFEFLPKAFPLLFLNKHWHKIVKNLFLEER